MPTKKKRAFTKKNSVKFLLLHGHENAQNADGETLKNVLVPVSKNYKPGSSLLMSRIAELVNESNPPGAEKNVEPNLEKIMGQFDDASDSDSEEGSNRKIKKALKNLKIKEFESLREEEFSVEEEFEDEEDNYSDFTESDSEFSDVDGFSSRQRIPENLKILEERMKKKLQEYGDDQLGALDDEEICGYLDDDDGNERVKNYISPAIAKEEEEIEIGKFETSLKEKILNYCEEDHLEEYVEIVTEKPIEYDCESIISTYSNKYNHPTVIKEEQKVKKIKIPNNPLKKHLTKSELKSLDVESESSEESDDQFSIASTMMSRPKGETPEQRRERKHLFKEAKRESRMLKKENKLAFKNEKKAQQALAMSIQNNRRIKL